MNRVADWLARRWLEARFGFDMRLHEARVSLPAALILLLRLGLPVTAFSWPSIRSGDSPGTSIRKAGPLVSTRK
jgi:hypothetical protein